MGIQPTSILFTTHETRQHEKPRSKAPGVTVTTGRNVNENSRDELHAMYLQYSMHLVSIYSVPGDGLASLSFVSNSAR